LSLPIVQISKNIRALHTYTRQYRNCNCRRMGLFEAIMSIIIGSKELSGMAIRYKYLQEIGKM